MAYFSLRDLDDDLDFEGPEIPDFDPDALVPPNPNQLQALDATNGASRWRRHIGFGNYVVGTSGDVLVFHKKGGVVGVDVSTGSTRWRADSSPMTTAGLGDGIVVQLTTRGSLVAYEAVTGVERWNVREAGLRDSYLEIGSGTAVVVSGETRRVHAFDLVSGTHRWSVGLPRHWFATAVVGDAVVLQATTGAVALDLATGTTRWTWTQTPSDEGSDIFTAFLDAPLPAGSVVGIQVLEPALGEGALPTSATIFIDLATGAEVWRTPRGALSSFAFDAATNAVFELGDSGGLIARDAVSGTQRWDVPAPFGRLFAQDGRVYLADDSVRVFDAATGIQGWSQFVGLDAGATPVAVVNGQLILTDGLAVREGDEFSPG